MLKFLIPAILALALSACGSTSGSLKYSAPEGNTLRASTTAQAVLLGAFTDQRDGDKNWLGVIRGGFGNHLKTLTADRPVTEIVRTAFADGLRARGVSIAATNANQITGKIITFNADQMVRREGNAEIELTVRDPQGATRFAKTYTANRLEGSIVSLSTGVLASVEDLRAVLERTLSDVIDKALDDPELRSALQI